VALGSWGVAAPQVGAAVLAALAAGGAATVLRRAGAGPAGPARGQG